MFGNITNESTTQILIFFYFFSNPTITTTLQRTNKLMNKIIYKTYLGADVDAMDCCLICCWDCWGDIDRVVDEDLIMAFAWFNGYFRDGMNMYFNQLVLI